MNAKIRLDFMSSDTDKDFNYLTYEDCKALTETIHKDTSDSILLIAAPKGSTVEVPIQQKDSEYPHQLLMNSNSGEIVVYLCENSKFPILYDDTKKDD